ncbi:MAG: transcription-repair coupling factor [Caldimicrobium sp.]
MFKGLAGVNASFLGYYFGKALYKEIEDYFLFLLFPENKKIKDFLSVYKSYRNDEIAYYPSLEIPPFSEFYTLSEEEKERLKVLWNIPYIKGIALDIKTFVRRTLTREVLKEHYLYLIPKEKIDREKFIQDLIFLGYERVGVVKSKGEFTVKGNVIDLFSPQLEFPVRIEFFGDEIIHLKAFDTDTQRSKEYLEELVIIPARELIFPKDTKEAYKRVLGLREKIPEKPLAQLLQMIEHKIPLESADFLLPLLYEKLFLLHENVKHKKVLFVLYERDALFREMELFWEKIERMAKKARARGKLFFEEELLFAHPEEIDKIFSVYPTLDIKELPFKHASFYTFNLGKIAPEGDPSPIEGGFSFLKAMLEEGTELSLFLQDEKSKETIIKGLEHRGVYNLENLKIYFGEVSEGFIWGERNFCLTSDIELFKKKVLKIERKEAEKSWKDYFRRFEDLKPGDYVVHKIHGIGRFQGLVTLKVDGFEGEFLEVEYLDGDKLYLPVTRLSELYPYVGVEDKVPQLDKLGKKTFLKRRKEVEKKLAEVVEEILKLYAERKALESFSIPFNSLAYAEFVQTFPYEETPDQLKAIEEILEDLVSSKPMDRLLVGDVGFGKTEVALRAIFVTAYAGKQVALLTPTTLLAEQHFRNMKGRLEPFGIKVGILSRLRSEKEQREVLKGLSDGSIQVVVGTHRLLSKDVVFKDLGLVVIDEEHRFGVKQKERLKQLKKRVKVLSLSATPIPRSLQLSLLGIFDLSLIETPPPGRVPVKTFLTTFEPEVIRNAIEEELNRGGQIYFVNPRIMGLDNLANFLRKLVPGVRAEVIHGQMEEKLIEKRLYKFLNREIDMLVCTPIIGSGIDIPSANTIFINRSDMFGLAEIYQLRGRVGRGMEQGYCYLLVPDLKGITEDAQKRLKALMQFVELGSGFKLSLSDLKIRGAGELLGIQQSGHINKVGYELYLELLENTIRSLKGEEIVDWEPEVNLKVSALIPPSYVPDTEERLSLYRELVLIKDLHDLYHFRDFLQDKYGNLPQEVENLITIYELKLLMKRLKILSLEEKGKYIHLLIKDLALLPRFRKTISQDNIKLIKVIEEKDRAHLYFQSKVSPLLDSREICAKLLS